MASRVGSYLLFETLGEGAFGKVKLGVHEETGEQVAVKIMDKSDIKAQEMTMNVRREIAIMKALKHRNIVNLRQVLTSQSKLYIVMDLVTGGELFTKILKEGKLPEDTARHYFQQLVDGIEYCHKRGVCHRDLKPENLLIDETTGELKITDFGLSAMKGASTTEELLHTQCGSPNYCAPEIIARHKQGYNGAKVDAWSCGIILYALLAGYLPFFDENTKILYRMIQKDEVKFPKKFPADAKDLIGKLLHKDPDQRFTLPEVKKHRWFLVNYAGDASNSTKIPSSIGATAALLSGGPGTSSGSSSPTAMAARRKNRAGRHARKKSVDHVPRTLPLAAGGVVAPAAHDAPARKKSEDMNINKGGNTPASSPPPPPPSLPNHLNNHTAASSPTPPSPLPPHPAHHHHSPSADSPRFHQYQHQLQHHSAQRPPVVPPPTLIPSPPTASSAQSQQQRPLPPALKHQHSAPTANPTPLYPIPPYPLAVDGERPRRQREKSLLSADDSAAQHSQPSGISDAMHVPRFPPPPPPTAKTSPNLAPRIDVQVHMENSLDVKRSPRKQQQPIQQQQQQQPKWTTPPPPPPYAPASPTPPASNNSALLITPPTSNMSDRPLSTGSESSSVSVLTQNNNSSNNNGPNVSSNSARSADRGPTTNVNNMDGISMVERRKLMYASSTAASNINPSVPSTTTPNNSSIADANSTSSDAAARSRVYTVRMDNTSRGFSEPTSMPGVRFGHRADNSARMTKNNSTSVDTSSEGFGTTMMNTSNVSDASSSASPSVIDHNNTAQTANDENDGPNSSSAVTTDDGKNENNSEDGVSGGGGGGLQALVADEDEAPLKQRLAAAVARYRRIFRLGRQIGITASPSFSSNRAGQGQKQKDKTATENESDSSAPVKHTDFFSRAKAVTGAWGIILSQELEEDSDSEDERPVVTEKELKAFSRLLDFWDSRRATANHSGNAEVMLDDESDSPLSEEDLSNIQSLLRKLEPKPVEDEVKEIDDGPSSCGTRNTASASGRSVGCRDDEDENDNEQGDDEAFKDVPENEASADPTTPKSVEKEGDTNVRADSELEQHLQHNEDVVPPVTAPQAAEEQPHQEQPRGDVNIEPIKIAEEEDATIDPKEDEVEPDTPTTEMQKRLPLSPSTLRDPLRAGTPPVYGAGSDGKSKDSGSGSGSISHNVMGSDSGINSVKEGGVATKHKRKSSISGGVLNIGSGNSNNNSNDMDGGRAYHSSNGSGGSGHGNRSTFSSNGESSSINNNHYHNSYGSTNTNTTSNNTSTGTSSYTYAGNHASSYNSNNNINIGGSTSKKTRGHVRTPSRDDHSTRGLFTFNMFNRRKSIAMTSFDTELPPDDCLLEIGRILVGMGCTVMMKKGENKMKCEAPIKQETLKISITCTNENNVSKVHLKKGRRDKSQVEAKEFYEFFQVVHARFHERVESFEPNQ